VLLQIRYLLPSSKGKITQHSNNPSSILLHIQDNTTQRKDSMPRILLKKKDKADQYQYDSESKHTIAKLLFFEDFDVKNYKERSQRKEKSDRIYETKFVPLTVRMKRFDAQSRIRRHSHKIISHKKE
jgi:hypothetical protein